MSKRITRNEPIIAARGTGWHVTYDRNTRDYAAIMDDGVLLGFFGLQSQAEAACRAYVYEGLVAA